MPYKHDYDKTLTRLVSILNILNTGQGVASKDIAEEFGVSVRTIQRDFSERLAMFPIYKDKGKWYFIKGYTLEKSLNTEDSLVLKILDKFAEGIGEHFYSRTKKLLAKITNEQDNPIYAKLHIEDVSSNLEEFKQLELAISKKLWIEFEYSSNKASYTVKARPLKIINYDGFWYLMAVHNEIVKKYYLKGISNIAITDQTFKITRNINKMLTESTNVWFQESNEPFDVKLEVSQEIARYLIRKPCSPTQKIIKQDKNGIIISVTVSHEMEILPVIKRWLPDIKVIEPQSLNISLKNMLEEYLKGI